MFSLQDDLTGLRDRLGQLLDGNVPENLSDGYLRLVRGVRPSGAWDLALASPYTPADVGPNSLSLMAQTYALTDIYDRLFLQLDEANSLLTAKALLTESPAELLSATPEESLAFPVFARLGTLTTAHAVLQGYIVNVLRNPDWMVYRAPGKTVPSELPGRRRAERNWRHVRGRTCRAADDVEAAAWFRRAAEQEHGRGQYHLGLMYMEGRSVPPG